MARAEPDVVGWVLMIVQTQIRRQYSRATSVEFHLQNVSERTSAPVVFFVMTKHILQINSSARGAESVSTTLADTLVTKLRQEGDSVTRRDLGTDLPFLSPETTAQMGSTAETRTGDAVATLGAADELIAELEAADVLVFGVPIYNFSAPASLKAWADLIAQAGRTFQYGANGPEGLLTDRPTYLVVSAGGVPIESPVDFGTNWFKQFLNFLGITNITVIGAPGMAVDAEAGLAAANASIAALAAA